MSNVGIPAEGFKTVGQIVGTNVVRFRSDQNAWAITIELLSAHLSGAPVLDQHGTSVGFISEFDILKALDAGKDLNDLTADALMVKDPIAVQRSTTIQEAIKIMTSTHLLNLPLVDNGKVPYSVTRASKIDCPDRHGCVVPFTHLRRSLWT